MARSEWLSERERKPRPRRLLEVGSLRESVRIADCWWIRCALLALALASAVGVAGAATAPNHAPAAQSVQNALPALHQSLWSKAGARVTAVKFLGVTFPAGDAIFAQLQQKAGQPLDPGKVRADERRLFATGMYVDLAVDLMVSGTGVTLVYAGQPRYFVGRVTIAGVNSSRLTSLLEFATRLDPGAPFSDGALAIAVEAVKEALAENGFFVPVVTMRTSVDPVADQVNVTFTVITGPQAHIGSVTVGGPDPGLDIATFRRKGHMNCGRLPTLWDDALHRKCILSVTRETVSNALSGVRSFYQNENRLEGTISLQRSVYGSSTRQVDYSFYANQGPKVEVSVAGVKLSRSRIKLLVPVYEEGAVDHDLLNEGMYNIKDYLQQKGYFNVTAKVQLLTGGSGDVKVLYTVQAGRKHKVTAVNIRGEKYFDSKTLKALLRVKQANAYQRSGQYSAQLVAEDVSSIEALYQANGFSQVKVTPTVKTIDAGPGGKPLKVSQLKVLFTVDEGPKEKFGNVELTGVEGRFRLAILGMLSARTGQPFSLTALSNDRDAILSYYLAHGYDHARVQISDRVEKSNPLRTDVTLQVAQGQQVTVRQVLLSGVVHTRLKDVQSQIQVHAGDPLDQAALLQTQRNLYNMAVFSEVNAVVQNPKGDSPEKDVLVQVTEAKRWDVTYGFGFEAQTGTPGVVTGLPKGSTTAAQNGKAGISPRVSLDVARINLRGTEDSLTLHSDYGLLEEIASLTYNVPEFLGKPSLTASISGGYANIQDITTFASSTLQGDLRLTQKVKRADTLIYDFEYRRVSVNPNSLEITPNLIPLLSEPVIVGGPQVTWIHDTRDPGPLNATKGHFFSLQEILATSKFGSQTNFNSLDGSESSYYRLGKGYVFARNTRIAFEESWGPNPNANNAGQQIGVVSTACAGVLLKTNPTCDAVPLPERLYVGGTDSHRGFGLNNGGPRDFTTGYPVGGSGAVVNNFELRMPPSTLPLVGDSISFVLFHDMGNAFEYPGEMFKSIERFHQPDKAACRDLAGPLAAAGGVASNAVGSCNFNYYSHALGVGVRYGTPVGPIRLDFSYNLNPPIYPVFDDFTGVPPYVGEASHFNFFFSIGQAF